MRRARLVVAGLLVATIAGAWLLEFGRRSACELPSVAAKGRATQDPHALPAAAELTAAPKPEPKASDLETDDPVKGPSSDSAPAAAKGPFHGRITGGLWKPVAHARIHRIGDPIDVPAIESREDGTFDVPDRGHREAVWIHAPDLVMAADVQGWLQRDGFNEIELVPGAPIRVSVVTHNGARPVAGAIVRSIAGDAIWSTRYARPSDEAVTDADGRASVLVPPGKGYVVVDASGFATARSPLTRVPEAGIDQRLELEVGAAVEGRVVTESDAPVTGATIRLVAGELFERVVVTKADGQFHFDGVPASVEPIGLCTRAEGFGPTLSSVSPLGAGATTQVDVRLAAAHALDVLCLASDGSPIEDVAVTAHPSDQRWAVVEGRGRFAAQGRSGPDGRVRLEPVGAGDAIVGAWSRQLGDEFETTTVSVPTAARVVSVVLRRPAPRGPSRSAVRMHVLDSEGKPVPEAKIQLRGLFGPPLTPAGYEEQLDVDTTDAGGVVRLTYGSITPTSIDVDAEGFASSVHPVTKADLERAGFEIRLSARSATLQFVLGDGKPAAVRVSLVARDRAVPDNRSWEYTFGLISSDLPTDGAGRVTFRGLGDLWYQPELMEAGFRIVAGPTSFRAGADALVWTLVPTDESEALRTPIGLIDATTDDEIWHAQIVVVDTGDLCEENGGAGAKFLSPPMTPGEHDLDVFVDGYLPLRVEHVALAGSAKPAVLRLSLDRGATIAGIVRYADGGPVAGIGVNVSGQRDATATTDEAGEYAISGLAAGEKTIVVASPLITRSVEKNVTADSAKSVRLNFVVESAGALKVNTNSGAPHGDIRLTLRDAGGAVVVNRGGQYLGSMGGGYNPLFHEIATLEALPPGRYWLDVTWDGVPERSIPVEVRLGEVTSVTLSQP